MNVNPVIIDPQFNILVIKVGQYFRTKEASVLDELLKELNKLVEANYKLPCLPEKDARILSLLNNLKRIDPSNKLASRFEKFIPYKAESQKSAPLPASFELGGGLKRKFHELEEDMLTVLTEVRIKEEELKNEILPKFNPEEDGSTSMTFKCIGHYDQGLVEALHALDEDDMPSAAFMPANIELLAPNAKILYHRICTILNGNSFELDTFKIKVETAAFDTLHEAIFSQALKTLPESFRENLEIASISDDPDIISEAFLSIFDNAFPNT